MTTPAHSPFLCPQMAGALLTPEEFDAVEDVDDGYVYELINGVLVVTPLPPPEVRGPNELLGYLLRRYQEEHPHGKALDFTVYAQLVSLKGNRRRAERVIWAGLGRLPDTHRDPVTIVIDYV